MRRHSEFVLLLNSDTIVPDGAIDGLIATLRAHDGIAAVGPRLVDGTGRVELSFGRMISPLQECGSAGCSAGTRPTRWTRRAQSRP